jgi:hypothetical protein
VLDGRDGLVRSDRVARDPNAVLAGTIDTVSRLGRPISTPWMISKEAGATISPARRYPPNAAGRSVAGSSTTPPRDGSGAERRPSSRQGGRRQVVGQHQRLGLER